MGRPLNKRYFGSLAASGIGGEGVASITITAGGTYTAIPGVSISAPALPGGVAATLGAVTMRALNTATVTTSGTGDVSADYAPADALTVVGGTGTAATFVVDSVKIRTAANVADAGGFANGDTVTFSGAGWSTPAVLTLTVDGGGAITGVAITNAGVWTNAILPSDPVTPTSTNGGGTLAGTTFNLGFGVNAVSRTNAGSYTALPSNPVATTTDSPNGTGATLTLQYEVLSVAVSDGGSGYVDASDAAVSFGAGAAAATAVLTTSTEPAITPYAKTISGGTVLPADIIKQTGENTYLMETTEGQALCTLGTTDTPNEGGAYLLATDVNGSTYYVTKLTAHLALLTQKAMVGSYVWETGDLAPWDLVAADNLTVQIANT